MLFVFLPLDFRLAEINFMIKRLIIILEVIRSQRKLISDVNIESL